MTTLCSYVSPKPPNCCFFCWHPTQRHSAANECLIGDRLKVLMIHIYWTKFRRVAELPVPTFPEFLTIVFSSSEKLSAAIGPYGN